jgi:ABC-type Mn2+/Zn2+ transport system ATPase subunit
MTCVAEKIGSICTLKAEGLTLGYHKDALVRGVSFEVHRGDILGLVGPNGCGKTTLLRTMLGLVKPIEGKVELQPNIAINYVPQRERIDTVLPVTALEVVLMGRTARAGAFRRIRPSDCDEAYQALALLGIEQLGGRLFRELSGGQQRRVFLARAVVTDSDLLVLDEPTAGMDVASEAAILDFLRDLNRRRQLTIVIVTHLLNVVLNFATSIMLMGPKTILYGSVDEVLQEEPLRNLYGVPVHITRVAGQRTLVVGG